LRCWRTPFYPERLTQITTELGGRFQIHYQPSASGTSHLPVPHIVVDKMRVLSGGALPGEVAAVSDISYDYRDGDFDVTRRLFRGFGHTLRYGPFDANHEGSIRETWFHQGLGGSRGQWTDEIAFDNFKEIPQTVESDALRGLVLKRLDRTGEGSIEEWELFGYHDVDSFPATFHLKQVQRDLGRCLGGAQCQTSRERSSYDTYGNELTFDKYGDLSMNGNVISVARSYQTRSNPYLVNLLADETTYDTEETVKRRLTQEWFYYDETPTGSTLTKCGRTPCAPSDPSGLLTRHQKWLTTSTVDNLRKDLIAESRFLNDNRGVRVCEIGPTGEVTKWTYDASRARRTSQIDSLGHVTGFAYTGDGPVGTKIEPPGLLQIATEPRGVRTTYSYDPLGRVTTRLVESVQRQTEGSLHAWDYRDMGIPGRQRIIERTSSIAGQEMSLHAEILDGFGRTLREENNGPSNRLIVVEHTFGSRGLRTSKTYPFFDGDPKAVIEYSYDSLGRITTVKFPDRTSIRRCWLGNEVFLTEQTGRRTSFRLDGLGRVIEIGRYMDRGSNCTWNTSSPYSQIRLGIDGKDRTVSVTAPNGSTAQTQFDGADHITSKANFGGITEHDDFDASGNLTASHTAQDRILHRQYDLLNRVTAKTDNRSSWLGGFKALYRYDEDGHLGLLTATSKGKLVESVLYDNLSNRTGSLVKDHRWTGQHEAVLDSLKRPTKITYQNMVGVDYEYNGPFVNHVGISGESIPLAAFSNYDASGNPQKIVYGNGVMATFDYEYGSGRLKESRITNRDGTTISDRQYRYDQGGNVLKIEDDGKELESFQYDALERLTAASGPYGSLEWVYDGMDRITRTSRDGDIIYDAAKPYEIGSVGGRSVRYDSSGRLTKGPLAKDGHQVSLRYDSEGHASSMKRGSHGVKIRRDADGDVVGKSHQRFWLDRTTEREVGEMMDCLGKTCSFYIFAGGRLLGSLIARTSPHAHVNVSERYFYHSDSIGSIRNVTNHIGQVVVSREFDPFGGALDCRAVWKGGLGLNVGFAGAREECGYGLIRMGERYYAPRIALFTSPDRENRKWPDPRWLNDYAYAFWSPTKYRDSSGRQPQGRSEDDWWGSGYERYSETRTSITSYSSGTLNTAPAGQTFLQLSEQAFAQNLVESLWVGFQLWSAKREQASISQKVGMLKESISQLDRRNDRLVSTLEVTTQVVDAWNARPSNLQDPLHWGPLFGSEAGRAAGQLSNVMLLADGAVAYGALRPLQEFSLTAPALIDAENTLLEQQQALISINARVRELQDRQEKLTETGRLWYSFLQKAGSTMVVRP